MLSASTPLTIEIAKSFRKVDPHHFKNFRSHGCEFSQIQITVRALIHRTNIKVKWSLYKPGVAQRVGRVTALLFHDSGTRRGWVVCVTPRPHFTPGKEPVPILQEAEWAPGPVWTGRKSRPQWDSTPDRRARCSVAIPTELPSPNIGLT